MRSTIIGKSKGSTQVYSHIAIGGRRLSGTTPNRPSIQLFDYEDYTSTFSQLLGTESLYVYTIADDEDRIYVGGTFAGTNTNYIAIYNKSDMSLVTFAGLNGYVYSIAVDNDRIYVGGTFQGTNQNNFAILNKSDLSLVTFAGFNNVVQSITFDDNYIYVGGAFTGTNQNYFAILNKSDLSLVTSSGLSSPFVGNSLSNDDENVYFGNNTNFYILNKTTLARTDINLGSSIYSTTSDDTYIYVGGAFTGTNKNRIAIYNKSDLSLRTFAGFNNGVYSIKVDDDKIYAGGLFTGTNQNYFAILNKSDLSLISGSPQCITGAWVRAVALLQGAL